MNEFTEMENSKTKARPKLTTTGKVLLGITGATFAAVCAVTTPFILPALRKICLPYVPATTTQVENVLKLLKGRSGTVIDLGSGDGRIVSGYSMTDKYKYVTNVKTNYY